MRLSRDDMFMQIAYTVSRRGTCSRAQVGAVIVKDGRIISIGYNGAPAGRPHCIHTFGSPEACTIAIHAELNAIAWASRVGVPVDSCSMYATHSMCAHCAVAVVASGISEVVYAEEYRLKDGLIILFDNDIKVRQYG